jgi:ATP phosphoribosyltransferase
MTDHDRISVAVQRSGRLSKGTLDLFRSCGIDVDLPDHRLLYGCLSFPLDITLVRDDDIPEYVQGGVCDFGVVGRNVLQERLSGTDSGSAMIVRELGFGHCRLALAWPEDQPYEGLQSLGGKRVATSYPRTLARFLQTAGIEATVIEISGSVEITPALGVADAVCDMVSTGQTLRSHGLREVATVLESQAVLVQKSGGLTEARLRTSERLLRRIDGVLKAAHSKYIMMNAPADAVEAIARVIPGMEAPTVIALPNTDRVAVHAVATEEVFWDTMDNLKAAGASSILVVPIEKIIN